MSKYRDSCHGPFFIHDTVVIDDNTNNLVFRTKNEPGTPTLFPFGVEPFELGTESKYNVKHVIHMFYEFWSIHIPYVDQESEVLLNTFQVLYSF